MQTATPTKPTRTYGYMNVKTWDCIQTGKEIQSSAWLLMFYKDGQKKTTR